MANKNIPNAAPAEQELNKQEAFFLKFRKQILIAVAALIIVVGGWAAYSNLVAGPREEKASTALARAQELFGQGEFQKALNGDKTMEGFLAVAENYSGTDAANLAKAYAGLCYANMAKWKEAVTYLEDFSAREDMMISPAITGALANAYANTGDVDKAISTFKKAAEMADSKAEDNVNNSLAPTYMISAARLLESQNKKSEALEIYKEVKEKYVNSVSSQDIDKYIERVSE
ncbi:MAG: tetratricopeptide repeat protein [Prevotella sp.]|nr:tetratricopeptide repeat protein [Prevotella sp.]